MQPPHNYEQHLHLQLDEGQHPELKSESQGSVGMVTAQNKYGSQQQALIQKKSLVYQKKGKQDYEEYSPELTMTYRKDS